ncbi:MAG: VWA domain-containing protein [Firmicutes bacterium]|nr:VWA domain-containing protein [Bacillota bacterium]
MAVRAAPLAAPVQQPIRVEVNLVLVEATVKDRRGQVVDGLQSEDFQLFEDGVEQPIAHFSQDLLPLAVALVVDLSGSIEPFLRPLRYATLTALKALKPEDAVALFTFTDQVTRPVALTRDKAAVSEQIELFTAGGGTNISRAVFEAAEYLKQEAPSARRVIVLVSDNVHTTLTALSHERVVTAALEADASVYSLKVPGNNRGLGLAGAVVATRVNVNRLAEATGGEVFDVEKTGSLYLAFERLIERLKTRYTLGYYPKNTARQGGFRKIEVRLRGHDRSQLSVLAKRGYYAPVAAAARP